MFQFVFNIAGAGSGPDQRNRGADIQSDGQHRKALQGTQGE